MPAETPLTPTRLRHGFGAASPLPPFRGRDKKPGEGVSRGAVAEFAKSRFSSLYAKHVAVNSNPEPRLDPLRAFQRRGQARVHLEVVAHAFVDAGELLPGEADHAIAPGALPRLEDVQRGEDADEGGVEAGE